MRLAITGKTRSGKSTAVHQILSHALRAQWAGIIILDGKGSELQSYAALEKVTYCGPDQLTQWAAALAHHANQMATRYSHLVDRGLRQADPADPRYLIVIDEVQKATRDKQHGKSIKDSLTLISEQSAALNDVLILSTQREVNAIPPSTRTNFNCWLQMLGAGYFYLQPDGDNKISGRTTYITPTDALARLASDQPPLPLELEHLPCILGAQPVQPGRAPVTIYLGEPGSGKTWRLAQHPRRRPRTIEVDLSQPHKQALTQLIEAAGAVVPARCAIPDMVEIAALALQAAETLLLLDNLHAATAKMIPTVERLIQAAGEVAMTANTPHTPAEHTKIDPFVSRGSVVQIQTLSKTQAIQLAAEHLPEEIVDPVATQRRIWDLSKGHPATVVNLATQTQRGSLEEIRHYQAPQQNEVIGIGPFALIALLFVLLLWRADGYVMTAALMMAIIFVRRLAIQAISQNRT
ncbi:MAG: hypothetical protein KDE53_28810 [Caldilineaceae bacterium]|nr:hypothetical protein [Caldilineaceae bacterium]